MTSPCVRCKRARPLLGTLVEITAEGFSEARTNTAIEAAFAVVAEVHARMSAHEATSDLAAFHAAPVGQLVEVSAHTAIVLTHALKIAWKSGGAFNPCLGGRMARWGYLPPARGEYSEDFNQLHIELPHLRREAALRLDLGGIAKGYAVDCAISVLQNAGMGAGVVNAGGDLRCFGPEALPVSLRDPACPQRMASSIALQNKAMATSAPYFSQRRKDGPSLSALCNPLTGRAHTGPFSVTVVARYAVIADALTKVALNAPPDVAARVLAEYGATAHWLGVPDAPQ